MSEPNDAPKIELRVGLDDDGFLYLYDAVSGREVARQRGITFNVYESYCDETEDIRDLQIAEVEVYTDPRTMDDDALEKAREELGGWHVDHDGPTPSPS